MIFSVISNLLVFFLLAVPANAETNIYIGITSQSGGNAKLAMGMPPFFPERPDSTEDAELGKVMRGIIRADLLFSRYFDAVETGPLPLEESPKDSFADWKKFGAAYLLIGKAADLGNTWTLTVRVYDLNRGEAVVEKYYRGDISSLRRAAHLFSDETVWRLTGKPGIAHTRIAFSNDATGKKEIYSIDYDGEGFVQLTRDGNIALLPRWSADGTKIYYTSYRFRNPDMFEINLKAGKISPFTTFQGLNIPGGISPDGKTMVMTISRERDPDIYTLDLDTKQIKQLTTRMGVNSSATYSPDGKQIAFVSDHTGNPQIHIMELETGKTRRLTRLNWCDSPSWSPTGEWIVFAGREDSKDPMDIYLVDLTGSQLRKLTRDAGSNEDPSWSPDGRFVTFTSTRNGIQQVYVMDSDGSAPHLVSKVPAKCYTPAWSP